MEFASRCRSLLALGRATLLGAAFTVLALGAAACHSRHEAKPGPTAKPGSSVVVGRVTDDADRAIPGAQVLLFDVAGEELGGGDLRREITDRAGYFVFERLAAGTYRLLVEAVGLASTEPPPFTVPGPEVVVRIEGQGRSVTGAVVSAGSRVPGARVRLGGEGGKRETLSDDAGQFVFHGLGAGPYLVRATRDGLVSATVRQVAPDEPGAARPTPLRLELGAGLAVAGVVVDDRGSAVAGAEVRVEADGAGDLEDPLAETRVTTPDGRFRVEPLPPGRVRVTARAPGTLLRAPTLVTLLSGQLAPSQRLELVRGAALFGRIVDTRGAAIAGAQLRCVGAAADALDLAVIDAPLPPAAEAAALGGGAGRSVGVTKTARSDARGAFRITDVLPGPVHLEIARPPFVPLATMAWTLASGEMRDVGALTMNDGVAIHGRVLDDAGGSLAGARVAVAPSVGVIAETDAAGTFSLALPAGQFTLEISAAGFADQSVALAPADGRPASTVEVRLGHAGSTVEGVAHDSGHRVLARARVRAFAADGGGGPLGSALTDAGGHFAIKRLPAQTLRLELDHPDYPPTFASATPGTAVELTAPIPGGIDGEVRERGTGAVVARARVDGVGPDGQKLSAGAGRGDKKGAGLAFRALRLTPGSWTLTATAPGYVAVTRQVDVPPSPILGETSVRGLRLELDRTR
jgi:Carboxypeptidase regulatory-like domain